MTCHVHHLVDAENVNPLQYSDHSAPGTGPMLPSWIRSRKRIPRLLSFFVTLTSRWSLVSIKCCFPVGPSQGRR